MGSTSRAIADTTMDVPVAIQSGMDLFKRILKVMPGCVSAYVHMARCLACTANFDASARALRKCLQLQPHCAPALLALARVDSMRLEAQAADRSLEQAVSADFNIRYTPLPPPPPPSSPSSPAIIAFGYTRVTCLLPAAACLCASPMLVSSPHARMTGHGIPLCPPTPLKHDTGFVIVPSSLPSSLWITLDCLTVHYNPSTPTNMTSALSPPLTTPPYTLPPQAPASVQAHPSNHPRAALAHRRGHRAHHRAAHST